MNAPVFGHGQLRLYLLSLLEEGPLSGYDVIRTLEQRFDGLYSPSAGTIYPRLAKLEEEGLVSRTDEGRRSIYSITDAGREELARRSEEVAGLGEHVEDSSARLAEELRRKVTDGATALWAELDNAAKTARARAEEQDRARAESSQSRREARDEREDSDLPPWMRANRGTFGGIPVDAFESLARDFTAANKFRSDHGADFARFAQWAAAGFGKGTGSSTPWWTARPEDAARMSEPVQPVEDEVIAEVIETEGDSTDDSTSPVGDAKPLGEAQVRRIIDVLRTAADDLENILSG
ncbi:MAG: PadR family transcriptional regulator [Dermatophilus congolensis]|nr:PadR family transcriptional regulator [Dermatophilus congolensis]